MRLRHRARHAKAAQLVLVFIAALLLAPGAAHARPEAPTYLDVRDYGARGDGRGDDRQALQTAIDTAAARGATVYIPDGRYRVEAAPGESFALQLRSGTAISGAGNRAVIQLAPGQPDHTRILAGTDVHGVTLSDFVLDGDGGNQPETEQMHGVFLDGASGVLVSRLWVADTAGDGIYPYGESRDVHILDCLFSGGEQARVGIHLGWAQQSAARGNRIHGYDWAVKSEPYQGEILDLEISDNAGWDLGSGGLGLTPHEPAVIRGVVVRDNTFASRGEHNVVAVGEDLVIEANRLLGGGENGIWVPGDARGVTIRRNQVSGVAGDAGNRTRQGAVVIGAGPGNGPEEVLVEENRITDAIRGIVVRPSQESRADGVSIGKNTLSDIAQESILLVGDAGVRLGDNDLESGEKGIVRAK